MAIPRDECSSKALSSQEADKYARAAASRNEKLMASKRQAKFKKKS
jgi:hypothetical protein